MRKLEGIITGVVALAITIAACTSDPTSVVTPPAGNVTAHDPTTPPPASDASTNDGAPTDNDASIGDDTAIAEDAGTSDDGGATREDSGGATSDAGTDIDATATCAAGTHACAAGCIPDDSPEGCATSCTPCQPPPGATASCSGTFCVFSCNGVDCHILVSGHSDQVAADGCFNGQCSCGTGPRCGSGTVCVAGACVCDTDTCAGTGGCCTAGGACEVPCAAPPP